MISTKGRIISRGGKIAGLFLPAGTGLPLGIFEIREVMGELTIVKIGKPYTEPKRFQALDLNGLMADRPSSVMTQKELEDCGQLPKSETLKRKTRKRYRRIIKSKKPPVNSGLIEALKERQRLDPDAPDAIAL